MPKPKPEMILWLSDAHGQYIPRYFATSFADRAKTVTNVSDDDWAILEAGPDHEHYWDTWSEVEQKALVTINGVQYGVFQDGDCWLVPTDMIWSDEQETFVWEELEKEQTND